MIMSSLFEAAYAVFFVSTPHSRIDSHVREHTENGRFGRMGEFSGMQLW
jgi:hypothetical protein